ncbi:MAG: sterol carrier protein domain-containing protein, partial [Clostridia bacterium]|nr:sterol carrier protein domain-containing protein [Clostridia bacterium]
ILPTVMARIVDIEKVLSKADIADIKIKVSDNLITENNGVYEKNGQAVIKTDKEEFDVALDIKALTQLVFGYFSAFELYFLGELDADAEIIKMLDKIFPKTKNYMNHIMEA